MLHFAKGLERLEASDEMSGIFSMRYSLLNRGADGKPMVSD